MIVLNSPQTCGHSKDNSVGGCVCAYCVWRRGRARKSAARRAWDAEILGSRRPTNELREEVAKQMGQERFEKLEAAMQVRA